MECQNTIKNLKINNNKKVGEVIIIVEGEQDEFRLLKHIFTKILNYSYATLKRNKILKYEFKSDNNSTIIVANTKNSSINTLLDDNEYKDKLYELLKKEYHRSLKNTPIYILWDRDYDTTKEEYYLKSLKNFTNSLDNNYELNGLLLLSYPCYEVFNLSNFKKRFYLRKFNTSQEAKKTFNLSKFKIKDINENTLLLAVENMNKSLLLYNIRKYDPSNFERTNLTIFKKEKECYENNKYFNALSLISIMLIDLGIIEEE